jgi:hypothetical protein
VSVSISLWTQSVAFNSILASGFAVHRECRKEQAVQSRAAAKGKEQSQVPYSVRRVVIAVKTYPELSSKHTETVCTVALDAETGKPIRLYPVPLRYLDSAAQYGLYDIIAVPVQKSGSDPRPESFKIDARGIVPLGHMDSSHYWRDRRDLVFRDLSWHFLSMDAVLEANAATHVSIGMIKPSAIVDVQVTAKAESERGVFERKSAELRAMKEADLFDPTYKDIGYLPNDIRLLWTCEERCSTCSKQPHRMKVLDWGLLELESSDSGTPWFRCSSHSSRPAPVWRTRP